MAGTNVQDLYGVEGGAPPMQSVDGTGSRPLSVRANPNAFGAGVGEAVGKVGDQAQDIVNKFQGLRNETLATNAESQYLAQSGAIAGQFRSTTGLASVNALPEYTKAIQDLRIKMRSQLPVGADRAFDMLTVKHEGYALNDGNLYAASQLKAAHRGSMGDLIDQSVAMAGRPDVASDPVRFNEQIGNVKSAAEGMLGGDVGPGTGLKQDADGNVSFDTSTPEGIAAQKTHTDTISTAVGACYENKYSALAAQNPLLANQQFQEEKSSIPPLAACKIQADLQPKVLNAHVNNAVSATIAQANQDHSNFLVNPKNPSISDAIFDQESSGGAAKYNNVVDTGPNGGKVAVGPMQITPDTWSTWKNEGLVKDGEEITNIKDNEAVGRRAFNHYMDVYKDDPDQIAKASVAYHSGPGNVSALGSPTPYINDTVDSLGKHTSEYVSDVQAKVGQLSKPNKLYATNPDGSPVSQADYYATHRVEIINNAMAMAEKAMPGDLEARNMARSRAIQIMDATISAQSAQYKQDNSYIQRGINGDLSPDGVPPRTYQELRSLKGMADILDRSNVHSPEFARNIDQQIDRINLSRGGKDIKEYGVGFMGLLRDINSGKITNPSQLITHLPDSSGNGGDITYGGYKQLVESFKKDSTETTDDLAEKTAVLKNLHRQFSFEDGTVGLRDPNGETKWSHALPIIYKAFEDGRSKNIPMGQLTDPESSNYVGNSVKNLMRSTTQAGIDNLTGGARDLNAILAEYKATSDPDRQAALRKEAVDLGFVRESRPKAPISE